MTKLEPGTLRFMTVAVALALLCVAVLPVPTSATDDDDGGGIYLLARTINTLKEPMARYAGLQPTGNDSAGTTASGATGPPDRLGLFLVQFKKGHMKAADKSSVEAVAGNKLGNYMPQNSFSIRCPWGKLSQLTALPAVQWAGEFLPEYKMSPQIRGGDFGAGAGVADGTTPVELYIMSSVADDSQTLEGMESIVDAWAKVFKACEFYAASKAKATASCPDSASAKLCVDFLGAQSDVSWLELKPHYTILGGGINAAIKAERAQIM